MYEYEQQLLSPSTAARRSASRARYRGDRLEVRLADPEQAQPFGVAWKLDSVTVPQRV